MFGYVNKTTIMGNLGADPESRRTQDGKLVVSFRVATSEFWRDRTSGERKQRTDWHSVVIFNEGLAKIAEKNLKKGSKVYLEGKNQTREWTDDKGTKRYVTEVVLNGYSAQLEVLDPRSADQAQEDGDSYPQDSGYTDEIPF